MSKTGNKKVSVWHECHVEDCDYGASKKSNVERHMKETHFGQKKICVCGKQFTGSSLSRHKRECHAILQQPVEKPKSETVTSAEDPNSYNIDNVEDSEILNVQEHTMVIKVVTKKDGTVLFAYKNFKFGETEYVLMPLKSDNEVQNMDCLELNGERIKIYAILSQSNNFFFLNRNWFQ